ncbi:hypothetical protein Xmau_03592 [Xenorhabdus mauleonii]|uniref:Uncharacterized protein n=1 Tax=Xenorhabdus mauleonii TaxID=351675 RepID=A0A1I3X507_9GAMM|nr:hypothetical protein [Xenorhabdus mauleonii]PHM38205.1 hypothetical protein Xmau_03592 [Xenorhabdus mauleonii]SFK13936.1 hypothetical protein SAMN05421680_13140 [Xenorhabdus mauleonii]
MGQYRHTESSILAITTVNELEQKMTKLFLCEEGKFHYFLDKPKKKPHYRLNIIGHSLSTSSQILFCGTVENAPRMNIGDFCRTVHNLLNSIRIKGHNIQSARIIACWSGANGFAQKLADYLNIPVKGSLGGTRLRHIPNVDRRCIDKPGSGSRYSAEEIYRQKQYDPHYGQYKWYEPQSLESAWESFTNDRISKK